MTLTLDQAIARIPFLAGASGLVVHPLTGGITNQNYRIEADGRSYVLRITGADTDKLGIRRDVEHEANLAAGQLGIGPEVLYFIEPEGYLLTRFIKGTHLAPSMMRQPEYIAKAAQKLRLFHTRGPNLPAEFNAFRNIEALTTVANENACKFPFDFDWIQEHARDTERALLKDPFTPNPCHNDLLNLNWLNEELPGGDTEVRLLDWEYAGMGDLFFDLANFCHHHDFSDDQVRQLLIEYFGELTPRHFARLKLMWPMSELREAMWGVVQTGISKLDEDFQGYADLWFTRVRQHLTDPRRERWLSEVG